MDSLSKNKNKWVKSLRLKKNREKESCFVVEGEKMVLEIIEFWPDLIEFICTTDDELKYEGELYLVDHKEMKELSSLKTAPKSLAVVKTPSINSTKEDFILVIDSVQDPGNMGTIIRTADWFGIDKIICSNETVDIFNSKVIQSSMGSLFRIPIEYCNLTNYLESSKLPIYGALLNGENIYKTEISDKAIIVIGNEGNGISKEVNQFIQHPILIPSIGNTESLNVSIATGIILAEFKRSFFQK